MKNNITLLISILIVGIFFLEIFAWKQIRKLIERNGYTKKLILFYDHYYKDLHHLGRLNEANAQNPTSLIFDKVGDGQSKVIIQGDSWAEQFRSSASKKFLSSQKDFSFVLAGTGSYSPSIMTSQLHLLRNDFNFNPEFLIAIIDQTDIGDELCRYRFLRKNIDGRIIVEPEPRNSFEPNASFHVINNFKMLFSDHYSIFKAAYYLRNKIIYRNNLKHYKVKCGRNQILKPLEHGLENDEKRYFIKILNDYFNEAFASYDLKELIIVTHPHKGHLLNNYIIDIESLITQAKNESIHQNDIKVLSFSKFLKNNDKININNIFIENDAYSHLKEEYFLMKFLPEVIGQLQNNN